MSSLYGEEHSGSLSTTKFEAVFGRPHRPNVDLSGTRIKNNVSLDADTMQRPETPVLLGANLDVSTHTGSSAESVNSKATMAAATKVTQVNSTQGSIAVRENVAEKNSNIAIENQPPYLRMLKSGMDYVEFLKK